MNARFAIALLLVSGFAMSADAADRQILLIAGTRSHGPLEHEHNAAVWQFQKWLNRIAGVKATAQYDGWPADASLVEKADAIFVFCTGGESHIAFQEPATEQLRKAAARGAGMMFYHYAVEPPAQRGHQEMLDWIGGYFALNYSVNPVFEADFQTIPQHPITRGVKPFKLRDEWYYNMRFREGMKNVTPILTTIPPKDSLSRPDGPHEGNSEVRAKAGQPMTVVWAATRPNGGRGVGFTEAHYHQNLMDSNFRKIVLNSLLWIAKADVPPNGVEVTVTEQELRERLDDKPDRAGRGGPPPPAKQ